MGQIIKLVCVCLCICVSICGHFHDRISWSIFTNWHRCKNPPKGRTSLLGVNIAPPLPLICPKNPHFRPRGPETHANIK